MHGKVLVVLGISMRLKRGARKMTTAEKVIKTKVGLLELGKQLGKYRKLVE
jgi:hypothetical protein